MTTATVAPPNGNGYAALLVMFLLVTFITCVVLWVHEQRSDRQGDTIAEHAEQLATLAYQMPALLEFLGVEIPAPVADDSPAAEHAAGPTGSSPLDGPLTPVRASDHSVPPDDAQTDEFPVAPPTVPDGMPLAVQSALIERPSPVPRGKSAEWVEPAIAAMRARNAERMARAITEEVS